MTRAGWAAGWAVWYGWVLCFVFALAPLLGWLSPLGFTPLAVLGGLLSLRAFQVSEADRPAALAILVLCLWALVSTIWSPFKDDTDYMAPSTAPFMVNFRVADLHALLAALRAEGCDVQDKVDESEYGKFGWVVDPEGNKLELWEPPAGR